MSRNDICSSRSRSPFAKAVSSAASIQSMSNALPIDLYAIQKGKPSSRDGWVKAIAPAKVNLFHAVGDKRENGYHEVESIMHALNLHDMLYMRRTEGPVAGGLSVEIECRAAEGVESLDIPTEDNLVCKALRLFAACLGRTCDEKVSVVIEKHIPAQAGLGGGSADAAAALLGAAYLWGIAEDDPRIEEAARYLGSDVAFFLRGGCACFTGTGETFDHALVPMSGFVTLVKPEGGVSTVEAYRMFDECPEHLSSAEREAALSAVRARDVPLCNGLVCAAEMILPELADVRQWISGRDDIEDALMSGSGSAVFVVCRDISSACNVAVAARARGWWSRTTMFGPARAAVEVPHVANL